MVGRLVEAHADADAIMAELTRRRVAPGEWWGVWAAEPPQPVLTAEQHAGGWVLDGTKAWCSGAGLCTYALVTAQVGEPAAADRRTAAARRRRRPLGLAAAGMSRSATGTVRFDSVPAEPVGAPEEYLHRSGFWHGAIGVAACWLGGAERVADTLRRAGPRLDDHGAAHLGAVDTALAGARWTLQAAAGEVDAQPATEPPRRCGRCAFERSWSRRLR